MSNMPDEELEARVAAIEERLTMESGLRASQDRDLADVSQKLSATRYLVQAMSITQAEHTEDLRGIREVQSQHTELFARVIQILGQHAERLDGHDAKLSSHTHTLDRHTQILEGHTRILHDHTRKLDRILEVLGAGGGNGAGR